MIYVDEFIDPNEGEWKSFRAAEIRDDDDWRHGGHMWSSGDGSHFPLDMMININSSTKTTQLRLKFSTHQFSSVFFSCVVLTIAGDSSMCDHVEVQ